MLIDLFLFSFPFLCKVEKTHKKRLLAFALGAMHLHIYCFSFLNIHKYSPLYYIIINVLRTVSEERPLGGELVRGTGCGGREGGWTKGRKREDMEGEAAYGNTLIFFFLYARGT